MNNYLKLLFVFFLIASSLEADPASHPNEGKVEQFLSTNDDVLLLIDNTWINVEAFHVTKEGIIFPDP